MIAEAATQQETINPLIGYNEKFFTILPIGTFTVLIDTTDKLGRIVYVECVQIKKGPNPVTLFGNCMEDARESCRIARTYTSLFMKEILLLDVFENQLVVNMLPSGMSKSGGSGGISFVTSMISCLLNMPPENDYAMTGEITLNGLVIEVLGLESKIKAAQRFQIKFLILPKAMRSQWEKIKEEEKAGITAIFVTEYIEIFKILFPRYIIPTKNAATY
uniref:Lon proteolytic domain-containing protein n=1 Tax=Meloidogyne enterolobii TaxID=390850 RepID=A0A6V7UZ03_MELEN|nr:unnamed protein product [Meloidogyne enterolobii]